MKYKMIVETSYKKTKIKRNSIIFALLFGCSTVKFGFLLRGQSPSPNVNHWIYSSFYLKVTGGLFTVWIPTPGLAPSWVWTRNLPICLHCLNPPGHSPPVKVFSMIWLIVESFWDFLVYLFRIYKLNPNYL